MQLELKLNIPADVCFNSHMKHHDRNTVRVLRLGHRTAHKKYGSVCSYTMRR